jgi:hypothetical protein
VQRLQSRLTERDAVVGYQHDLLGKAQSDLVEARVAKQQPIQLPQPSIPATVSTPDTSNPAELSVCDVTASAMSDDIDTVRLYNSNCVSIYIHLPAKILLTMNFV